MAEGLQRIIQIANSEFRKLLPESKATGVEVEEIEEQVESGHYIVTLGYWARDNKPTSQTLDPAFAIQSIMKGGSEELLNPWRKKYKRVVVDPERKKAIAIRMYEPPLGVS